MFVYIFEVLRWVTFVYSTLAKTWGGLWDAPHPLLTTGPTKIYFLSETDEYDESYTRVPEDAVYMEEWEQEGEKKVVVRYEGEEIPTSWDVSPFTQSAKCPWIWVGDKTTEIDLTKTFGKFLVPGNRITMDLVLKLIQVTDDTSLMYIDAKTFNEEKFPGDGILIEADGASV